MARGDGIDRTNARNMRLTAAKIGNTQQHNEREKDSYVNQDIVPERTSLNIFRVVVIKINSTSRAYFKYFAFHICYKFLSSFMKQYFFKRQYK